VEKIKQIVFVEKNIAKLLESDFPQIGEHEVVVKTTISTISCGTERANLTGDLNINGAAPAEAEAHFPRFPGYCSTGVVVGIGDAVKSVSVGDRVVVFMGFHKNYNIMPEDRVVKIEEDVTDSEAAMAYIATFPLAAVRKTKIELGESALVMGLGILGQFAVQFAHAAGAVPVIAADPNPVRREMALKLGADYALDPLEEGFADKVKQLSGGGVNAAIEVTGVGAGLDETLDCMKKYGRVALLGCTRDKNFTIDYYRKVHFPGIQLIGAHTAARPETESYPNYWTHQDDIKAYLRLCASKRIHPSEMIGEVHKPEECEDVFHRLAFDKDFPVVVQFDWQA